MVSRLWTYDGARESRLTDGMYLAVLASNNGRSHSHNDTGNFVVYQDGQPVAIDVGVEAYTAKTFGRDRYTIWTMQSAYHNLPTVGGVMQQDGVDFQATDRKYDTNDQPPRFRSTSPRRIRRKRVLNRGCAR